MSKKIHYDTQLLLSNEFALVRKLFFTDEMLVNVVVGEVHQLPHLLVLTNQRLLMINKNIFLLPTIVQYGLEEIVDVRAFKLGGGVDLTVFVENKSFIKMNYVPQDYAIGFVNDVMYVCKIWLQTCEKFLAGY